MSCRAWSVRLRGFAETRSLAALRSGHGGSVRERAFVNDSVQGCGQRADGG
jgi:hypothetical protein